MLDRDPLNELDALLGDEAPAAVPTHLLHAVQAEPACAPAEVLSVLPEDTPSALIKCFAGDLSIDVLKRLKGHVDRGEFDADDLMNLLPKVHKIKIDEEKVELQRTGGRENLPTLHFTIGLAGQIRAECNPAPHVEVLEAVEVVERMPTDETPEPAHLWSVDIQPIDGTFDS